MRPRGLARAGTPDDERASEHFGIYAPTKELVHLCEAALDKVLRKATAEELEDERDRRRRCGEDEDDGECDSLTASPNCDNCKEPMSLYATSGEDGRLGTLMCGQCAYAARRLRLEQTKQPSIASYLVATPKVGQKRVRVGS